MFHAPMGRFQLELFIFIIIWDESGKIGNKNK